MVEKVNQFKTIHDIVIKLNKVHENTQDCTYGVYSDFVSKLTHYFSIAINEKPPSIHNVVHSN